MTARQFNAQLKAFEEKVRDREKELFRRVDEHVGRSIRVGSDVTGAPGQPVKSGALLNSWKRSGSVEARYTTHYTQSPYGHVIENNMRGAKLRSKVGGFHSVKLTRNGFIQIVRQELAAVRGDLTVGGVGWTATTTGVAY